MIILKTWMLVVCAMSTFIWVLFYLTASKGQHWSFLKGVKTTKLALEIFVFGVAWAVTANLWSSV